jgi:hypothetical protein
LRWSQQMLMLMLMLMMQVLLMWMSKYVDDIVSTSDFFGWL